MKLLPNQIELAEYVRSIYVVSPTPDTSFEEVLAPSSWAHIAQKIKIGSRIEVMPEDGSYFAELLVQDVGAQWLKLVVLRHVEITPAEKVVEDEIFKIQWAGPNAKYRVLRIADLENMKDGFVTKTQASDWIREHKKALAA